MKVVYAVQKYSSNSVSEFLIQMPIPKVSESVQEFSEPLAHSGGHLLVGHLRCVASLASEFGQTLGPSGNSANWVYLAGLWHDLGKYRSGFQRYLKLAEAKDAQNAHIEGRVAGREKTHSIAGALWALQSFKAAHGKGGELAARTLAYLIASHHAGLYDWDGGLKVRLVDADSHTELAEACRTTAQ